MTFTRVFVLEQNFTRAWGALGLLLCFGGRISRLGGISSNSGAQGPKMASWCQACIQYLNCRGDSSPRRDLASPDRGSAKPHRDLSVPPSTFSNFHTKRKISGHLNEKVVSNGNHYKTPAEVSTNLWRKLFFLVYT